jgi:hypothetical protein
MIENKDTPAFPVLEQTKLGDKLMLDCTASGLTKREKIAAMILQGLVSNEELINRNTPNNKEWREDAAEAAVSLTDVLLEKLSKS